VLPLVGYCRSDRAETISWVGQADVEIKRPVPGQGLVRADGVVVDAVALGVHGQVEDVVDLFEEQVRRARFSPDGMPNDDSQRGLTNKVVSPRGDHAAVVRQPVKLQKGSLSWPRSTGSATTAANGHLPAKRTKYQ
jgi:hypothetical protein